MGRFFLSGQTTCALLLGAGLLLRAQAALRPADPAVSAAAPHTRPAEMLSERAPRVVRAPAPAPATSRTAVRGVHRNSHTRKGFAHGDQRHHKRSGGVALAGRPPRGG